MISTRMAMKWIAFEKTDHQQSERKTRAPERSRFIVRFTSPQQAHHDPHGKPTQKKAQKRRRILASTACMIGGCLWLAQISSTHRSYHPFLQAAHHSLLLMGPIILMALLLSVAFAGFSRLSADAVWRRRVQQTCEGMTSISLVLWLVLAQYAWAFRQSWFPLFSITTTWNQITLPWILGTLWLTAHLTMPCINGLSHVLTTGPAQWAWQRGLRGPRLFVRLLRHHGADLIPSMLAPYSTAWLTLLVLESTWDNGLGHAAQQAWLKHQAPPLMAMALLWGGLHATIRNVARGSTRKVTTHGGLELRQNSLFLGEIK